MKNKNKLLWMMQGADGVKTGFTRKAGRCLASSASKDGQQVALIVLRDGNDWADSAHLLTYGLTGYERRNITEYVHRDYQARVRFGQAKTVKLLPAGVIRYPLHRDETAAIVAIPQVNILSAPVKKGQTAGKLEFRLHAHVLGTVNLVAAESVAPKGLFGRLRELFF